MRARCNESFMYLEEEVTEKASLFAGTYDSGRYIAAAIFRSRRAAEFLPEPGRLRSPLGVYSPGFHMMILRAV